MKVGVVGAGRVGLISGLVLCELGHELTLFDIDGARVRRLQDGAMPFFEPDADAVLRMAARSGRWTVTGEPERLAGAEAIIITVPTPAGPDRRYDLAALEHAAAMLGRVRAAAAGRLHWRGIFLRSTVLPGTTERTLIQGLVRSAPDATLPCPVGHLPEFLRQGTALADARRPDRIVVGADDPVLPVLARGLFAGLDTVFLDTSIRTAELMKTANNAMLSVCISFANEIARLADSIDGADAAAVFAGLHLDRRLRGTPTLGIADYLLPGPGFGGSCLGKDLAALAAFGQAHQQEMALLEAALRVNTTQPRWFVDRIERALGGCAHRRVLVLGLAFKPDTDDLRDSIAIPITRELARRGAAVCAHDDRGTAGGQARAAASVVGVPVLGDGTVDAAIDSADAVVLVTPSPLYMQALTAALAARTTPLLFADARGVLRDARRAPCVTYLGLGGHPEGKDAS